MAKLRERKAQLARRRVEGEQARQLAVLYEGHPALRRKHHLAAFVPKRRCEANVGKGACRAGLALILRGVKRRLGGGCRSVSFCGLYQHRVRLQAVPG